MIFGWACKLHALFPLFMLIFVVLDEFHPDDERRRSSWNVSMVISLGLLVTFSVFGPTRMAPHSSIFFSHHILLVDTMAPKLPKLQFQNICDSLVGRSEQQKVLSEAFKDVVAQQQQQQQQGPQVVCLEGESGSGKTYLVDCWWRQEQENNKENVQVAFGKGKIDQKQSTSYGALVDAVSALIDQVPNADDLRDALNNELEESELKLLSDFVPRMRSVMMVTKKSRDDALSSSSSSSTAPTVTDRSVDGSGDFEASTSSFSDSSQTTFSAGDSWELQNNPVERFSFVFQEFLVCLSKFLPTCVILFIDDLQWADSHSMQMLQHIVANPQLSHVLLLLAARPDASLDEEVYPDLHTAVTSTGRTWRRLAIEALDLVDCNQMVAQLTNLSADACLELTNVCYAKTKGNPFFFLRFLESLQRRELITYSLTQFQFTWDIHQLKTQTDLADNVAAIVLEGIQALDTNVQHTLRIASRLGFSFGIDDLTYVLERMKGNIVPSSSPSCFALSSTSTIAATDPDSSLSDSILQEIKGHLHSAVNASLVDDQGQGRFKFAHDQILQSCLTMTGSLPQEALEEENLVVGRILLSLFRRKSRKSSSEWALFAALQALNKCCPNLSKESQMILVMDNCLAAQTAFKKSAFNDAARYARAALDILKLVTAGQPWTEKEELCRKVHLMAARYELACGNHDQCKIMVEKLLENTHVFEQKVDAYFTLACSLRNQSIISDSTDLVRQALKEMGDRIPNNPNQIQNALVYRDIKKEFIKLSEEDLLNARPIARRRHLNRMKFMSILFLNSYYQHEHNKTWFVLQRMLETTKEFGVCEHTPLVVAAYAYHLANRGEFTEGSRFGEIAAKLVVKLGSVNLPIVTFFLVVFVNHLRNPMFKSLPDLKHGFQVGMEHGDSQAAFLCATTDVCYQFMVGSHLQENTESCANYFRLAHEYGQTNLQKEILLMWQLASNLLGVTTDTTSNANAAATRFDGVAMGEQELMQEITEVDKPNYYKYLQSINYIYMGCWDEASDVLRVVLTYDNKARLLTSHYSTCFSTVYGAITWYKILAKKKDRKLLAKAGKATKAIQNRVKNGAINLAAGLWFIDAQKAAMTEPFGVVKEAFMKAIAALHRCGLRNLEGLACRCFAEFALEHGDVDYASDYMKRAYQAYQGWGARAVLSTLETKHGSLLK